MLLFVSLREKITREKNGVTACGIAGASIGYRVRVTSGILILVSAQMFLTCAVINVWFHRRVSILVETMCRVHGLLSRVVFFCIWWMASRFLWDVKYRHQFVSVQAI